MKHQILVRALVYCFVASSTLPRCMSAGERMFITLKNQSRFQGELLSVREQHLVFDTLDGAWIKDVPAHAVGITVVGCSDIDTVLIQGVSTVAKYSLIGTAVGVTSAFIFASTLSDTKANFFGGGTTPYPYSERLTAVMPYCLAAGILCGLAVGIRTSESEVLITDFSQEQRATLQNHARFPVKEPPVLKNIR